MLILPSGKKNPLLVLTVGKIAEKCYNFLWLIFLYDKDRFGSFLYVKSSVRNDDKCGSSTVPEQRTQKALTNL